MTALLEIDDLEVGFGGRVSAVRGISLAVRAGETHCLVGESGCGKSVTALAVMNLLARGATRRARRLALAGQDLLGLSARGMAKLAGNRIAMIFQEPMTSLNPAYTIGSQMVEGFLRHRGGPRGAAMARAETMLGRCGISAPGMRLGQFPHQLSGGLRQRVMIAMALMCEPELLIADEPTTALDVTVQAQILRLLAELQREMGLSILLITHDLGVVARMAHRVSVMYAGKVVEEGGTAALFAAPEHPYTRGLIGCIPVPGRLKPGEPLGSIPGSVPRIGPGFSGCAFRDRCGLADPVCENDMALRGIGPDHALRCRLPAGWQAEWPPRSGNAQALPA
jgi:peptide/nickel transport system ATP-binding protein